MGCRKGGCENLIKPDGQFMPAGCTPCKDTFVWTRTGWGVLKGKGNNGKVLGYDKTTGCLGPVDADIKVTDTYGNTFSSKELIFSHGDCTIQRPTVELPNVIKIPQLKTVMVQHTQSTQIIDNLPNDYTVGAPYFQLPNGCGAITLNFDKPTCVHLLWTIEDLSKDGGDNAITLRSNFRVWDNGVEIDQIQKYHDYPPITEYVSPNAWATFNWSGTFSAGAHTIELVIASVNGGGDGSNKVIRVRGVGITAIYY